MASDDQVLLRLVIKGMDPAEVTRLAQQTYGALKTEAAQHIDRLAALHRARHQEMTDDAKKYNEEAIKHTTKALSSITAMMRQQEIAANAVKASMDRWLERMENVTTIARGLFDIVSGGISRFKALAEEIATTTNVYGSLKGSIEEMREASGGEISDMDLILTKNRAVQKELELTDEQFGMLAVSADAFADELGTNTKEALDALVDGLANGNTRMLKSAGIVIDTDRAYVEYGEKIGIATNRLTDHEKKLAVVEASLRAMDEKIVASGGAVTNFASNWDKSMAQLQNLTRKVMLWLGDQIQDFIAHWQRIPDNIRIIIGRVKDLLPMHSGNADAAIREALENQAKRDNETAERNRRNVEEAKARLATPGSYDQKRDGAAEDAQRRKQFADAYAAEAKKAADEAERRRADAEKFIDGLFAKLGQAQGGTVTQGLDPDDDLLTKAMMAPTDPEGLDQYVAKQKEAAEAEEKRFVALQKVKGVSVDAALAYEKMAASLGISTEALTQDERAQALANEARLKAEEIAVRVKEEHEAALAETSKRAGFLGVLLWGPDGPDQAYDDMSAFMQATVDMFGEASGMLKSHAMQMSEALAKSIGAAFRNQAGWKTILKNATHDILESLATQAGARAIFEAAAGFAFLATGNFPSATSAFTSAALFGTLAVGAGLGAYAIGKTPPAAAASKAKAEAGAGSGSGLSRGGGGFGGEGSRGSIGSGESSRPIIVNINSAILSKTDVARAVKESFEELEQQTGEKLLARPAA